MNQEDLLALIDKDTLSDYSSVTGSFDTSSDIDLAETSIHTVLADVSSQTAVDTSGHTLEEITPLKVENPTTKSTLDQESKKHGIYLN